MAYGFRRRTAVRHTPSAAARRRLGRWGPGRHRRGRRRLARDPARRAGGVRLLPHAFERRSGGARLGRLRPAWRSSSPDVGRPGRRARYPCAQRQHTIAGGTMSETTPMPDSAERSAVPTPRRRRTKLGIVGAGAVGSTLAYASLMRGAAQTVALHDINGAKVRAEALDLAHGIQFMPMAKVEGSDDVGVLADSDVIVFTAGAKQKPAHSRLLLAEHTAVAAQSIHAYVVGEHGDSELPLWSSASIGSVPLLQWRDEQGRLALDEATRDRIATDVVESAYRIIEGKGATNYAIGLAATRVL